MLTANVGVTPFPATRCCQKCTLNPRDRLTADVPPPYLSRPLTSSVSLGRSCVALLLLLLAVMEAAGSSQLGSETVLAAAIPVFDNQLMLQESGSDQPDLFDIFVDELQGLSGLRAVRSGVGAHAFEEAPPPETGCAPPVEPVDTAPATEPGSLVTRLQHVDNLNSLARDCNVSSTADIALVGDSAAFHWPDSQLSLLCQASWGGCLNLASRGQSTSELLAAVLDYTRSTCLSPKLWIIQSGVDDLLTQGSSVSQITRNILLAAEAIR